MMDRETHAREKWVAMSVDGTIGGWTTALINYLINCKHIGQTSKLGEKMRNDNQQYWVDNLGMKPEIWNWAMKKRTGMSHIFPQRPAAAMPKLVLITMPMITGSVWKTPSRWVYVMVFQPLNRNCSVIEFTQTIPPFQQKPFLHPRNTTA